LLVAFEFRGAASFAFLLFEKGAWLYLGLEKSHQTMLLATPLSFRHMQLPPTSLSANTALAKVRVRNGESQKLGYAHLENQTLAHSRVI
jgi:hypothetical protein